MIKKLLFISVVFVLLSLGTPVIVFPIISIDGHYYKRNTILGLKARREVYFDKNLSLLSDKVNKNIEGQFSAYMESLNKGSFADNTDRSLSNMIAETVAEMDMAENKFIEEFENILKNKKKRPIIIMPFQLRETTTKDALLNDIFPKKIKNYSINDRIYYSMALDAVKEKLKTFRNEFPQIAGKAIKNIVVGNHEQYLKNLAWQKQINADVNNPLQKTMRALREQGETMQFFEHLISECDVTEVFNDNYFLIEPADISEEIKPILLPVCISNGKFYDAFALEAVSGEIAVLRDRWKLIREENIKRIINSQERTVNRNFSLYMDIDDGIDIDELPVLISYYGKQIQASADLFASDLEQCMYAVKDLDKYPIVQFNGIDISPLSIDIVNINRNFYDAVALSSLNGIITAIRANWNRFLVSAEQKIRDDLKKFNYNDNKYLDNNIINIVSVVDYISEVSDASGGFFQYLYDNCSVIPWEFAGTAIESKITEIDIEPLLLGVVEINGIVYYASGVNALRQSMQNTMGVLIAEMRKDLISIISTKGAECIENIDPYLAWYFDYGNSNEWVALLWGAFKAKTFGYNQAAELNTKYRQHFYPFFELENEIQSCLLKYSKKTQELAAYYITCLDIFKMSPYLNIKTDQIMEVNDFMSPSQLPLDYIRSFIKNSGEKYKVSFFSADNNKILNYVKNVMNDEFDIAKDADAGIKIGAADGLPGLTIGVGVSVISCLASDASAFKPLRGQKFDEYKALLKENFEKYCRDLQTAAL